MKKQGTSMLFLNAAEQVLLYRRDDRPDIPYPGRWDLFGGGVEAGETPGQCIVRELKEEIEFDLAEPRLFKVYDMPDRQEFTYWQQADLDAAALKQHEGSQPRWFSEAEVNALPEEAVAFGFQGVIREFFCARPWEQHL